MKMKNKSGYIRNVLSPGMGTGFQNHTSDSHVRASRAGPKALNEVQTEMPHRSTLKNGFLFLLSDKA